MNTNASIIKSNVIIRQVESDDFDKWLELRIELWPESDADEHQEEMRIISSGGTFDDELEWSVYVAVIENQIFGFIESSLRNSIEQWGDGPLGYIEGWFIDRNFRKQGIGQLLVEAAESWAQAKACRYMASDVEFDNEISLIAHKNLDYRFIGENDESTILIKNIGNQR